jgi:4,5-dihydroxyphthalate decarboxylase
VRIAPFWATTGGPTASALKHAAIDVVLRYHHEQGLTKRRFTIEDVFFPVLLDT